jgi:hypothetical protein
VLVLTYLYTRWENNINIDVSGTGWGGMVWIHVDQDRDFVKMVIKLQIP